MSHIIELPDPLFAEINRYATRAAISPLGVVHQAWEEFRARHPQETAVPPPKPSKKELLAMVDTLTGSLSLPAGRRLRQTAPRGLAGKVWPALTPYGSIRT